MSTSSPPSPNAVALYQFLENEWTQQGLSCTAWSRSAGIPDPTVLRWKKGTEPDLRNLRKVANALNRSLVQVMQIAGYVDEDETTQPAPAPTVRMNARDAIRLDDELPDEVKEILLQVLDGIMLVASGQATSVRRSGRTKTAKPTKPAPARRR